MRRAQSPLVGKTVEILADGMEYPVKCDIKRIVTEKLDSDYMRYMYECEIGDEIMWIEVDSVVWVTTKKQKYRHLKVVDLHATKKV